MSEHVDWILLDSEHLFGASAPHAQEPPVYRSAAPGFAPPAAVLALPRGAEGSELLLFLQVVGMKRK